MLTAAEFFPGTTKGNRFCGGRRILAVSSNQATFTCHGACVVTLRRSTAEVRFNTIVRGRSSVPAQRRAGREQGTWITPDMITAYERLHDEGWAHSVEVWQDESLVGGLYGLAIGRAFFGESMFSGAEDASKIALLRSRRMMDSNKFGVLDCQVVSSHLLSLGAADIPRDEFVGMLKRFATRQNDFKTGRIRPYAVRQLLPVIRRIALQ